MFTIKDLIFFLLFFLLIACFNSPQEASFHSFSPTLNSIPETKEYMEEWMGLSRQIITEEIVSPPEASRIFAYTGLAIYESTQLGVQGQHSLSASLNGFNGFLELESELPYDWATVMISILYYVNNEAFKRHISAVETRFEDLKELQLKDRRSQLNEEVVSRSYEYGKELSKEIIAWMQQDNFDATRDFSIYQNPSRIDHPERWVTTDFGQTAMEPFWSTLRPYIKVDQSVCQPTLSVEFDTDKSSIFYQHAIELVSFDRNITPEQMEIAFFWADCPGDTPTPAGHWNAILGEVSKQLNLDVATTARMYALVGLGMGEAFISCWDAKYSENLVRPKTYIQENIGPSNWEPFVEPPPFPEYTAGHAVVSNTVAGILTHLLGDSVGFEDSFHNNIGLMTRNFSSFQEAADEAGMSRIYGGIHYRFAIEDGKKQATCIVDNLLKAINDEI